LAKRLSVLHGEGGWRSGKLGAEVCGTMDAGQWMRDKAGIISCYYSSAASPQGEGARVVWVTGVSLEHRQAKRVNAGRTSESIACKGGCR
jgi:hypothetical protein